MEPTRMDPRRLVEAKARAARVAAGALAMTPTKTKNDALTQMARGLEEKTAALLEANRADLDRARAQGVTRAFLDRLTLTDSRIDEMAAGLRQIAALPDPVGSVVETWRRPNGLEISRVRVPLGVIGFIYESRPNVTTDAVGLCLKSGNAVVLRGGSEAIESNAMIAAVLAKAVEKAGAPPEAILTNTLAHARRFTREVDAAAVLVNASTRLVDGGQFGMGAEMGISTSRVHARGPVGVQELTTMKYVVQGDGQLRD